MAVVFLRTGDQALPGRFARSLPSEAIVLRGCLGQPLPISGPHVDCTIDDCRNTSVAEIRQSLIAARSARRVLPRHVALSAYDMTPSITTITSHGSEALDVIIADSAVCADVVCAHIHDPSRSTAAAVSLASLTRVMPPQTQVILRAVLAHGVHLTSVKQLASSLQIERTTIEKGLRPIGCTPRAVIDVALASYAVALANEGYADSWIMTVLGYQRRASLTGLLARVFGVDANRTRVPCSQEDVMQWIDTRVSAYLTRSSQPSLHALGTVSGV